MVVVLAMILAVIHFKCPRFANFDLRLLFLIAFFANFLDYITTLLVVSQMGINHEGNPFMRELMQKGWFLFIFYKLGVLSTVIACLVFISSYIRILSVYIWTFSAMLFLVAIHNIVFFVRYSNYFLGR